MKYKLKALQMSLAIHVLIISIIFLVDTRYSGISKGNLIVVDLNIEISGRDQVKSDNEKRSYTKYLSKDNKRKDINKRNKKIKPRDLKTTEEEINKDTISLLKQDIEKEQNEKVYASTITYNNGTDDYVDQNIKSSETEIVPAFSETLENSFRDDNLENKKVARDIDNNREIYSPREKGYLKFHFSYIEDMIQQKLTYPQIAREKGWEGMVEVAFVIASDGSVSDVKIIKSSGFNILDINALNAVKDASPFPKPPVKARIVIPIQYRLN